MVKDKLHISTELLKHGSYLHPQILSQHLKKEQKEIYIHVLQYVLQAHKARLLSVLQCTLRLMSSLSKL